MLGKKKKEKYRLAVSKVLSFVGNPVKFILQFSMKMIAMQAPLTFELYIKNREKFPCDKI